MDKKIEQLMERYNEKRKLVELRQHNKIEELSLEAQINLKEIFLDSEEAKEFGKFDQFFQELHKDLLVKQEEFNKQSQEILDSEKQKLYDCFTKLIEEHEVLKISIVENVMEKTMAELETSVFVNQKPVEAETIEVLETEIVNEDDKVLEKLGNKEFIKKEKAPNEMISTIDLEDMLTEIKTTIDE